jgi:biliverdin reductase
MKYPVKVGIVGTGYAAQKRAEALKVDQRAELCGVISNNTEKLTEFCQSFHVSAINSWEKLVNEPAIDVVFVCTINRDHGAIARAAIEANKHVVVEYPLSLNPQEAAEIIALASAKQRLIHVEHIELIGGVHQAIRENLVKIGNVFYARYATIAAKKNVARSWSYHHQMWGFPLSAALSRVHRLTDLFGDVTAVNCQSRYWNVPNSDYFTACLCSTQLRFLNGIMAEITYGKGDIFSHSYRHLEIQGDRGTLSFVGEQGTLIQADKTTPLKVLSRRGLFAKDTAMVLDHLITGKPLYVQANASLKALEIADAARNSSTTNQISIIKNNLNV